VTNRERSRYTVDVVNRTRKRAGLKPYRHSPLLMLSALAFGRKLLRTHRFGHDPFIRVPKKFHFAGECLAEGIYGVEHVVAAWMQSEDHRRILLSKRYRWAGFGRQIGGVSDIWVGHFGRIDP
jgi:uncharacterized protein YkwD